jgi:hypothetical protein
MSVAQNETGHRLPKALYSTDDVNVNRIVCGSLHTI